MPKINLKSRIVGHGEEAPDNLTANPLNYRRHPKEQLNALKGSMKELGWIKTVIVNKRSGYVLDGHARVEEAIRQGLPSIPVTYVDLDENEEKLALAVLDPITELAYRDETVLKELLNQVKTEDSNLNELLKSMQINESNSIENHWKDMPEYLSEDAGSFRKIIVHFDTEEDVLTFFKLIEQNCTTNTKSIWFPKKKNADLKAIKYINE